VNGRFPTCDICGALGHRAGRCPLRRLQEMQDPYGVKRRPPVQQEPTDPAVRQADERTIFLPTRVA
jgi:hypothetical protein